jgi:FdhD protein
MERRATARVPVRRIGDTHDDRSRSPDHDPDHDPAYDEVIVEEPMSIRLDGTLVTTTMRTPGHDLELAAGFCFTDGLLAGAPITRVHHVVDDADEKVRGIVDVETGGRAPTPVPRLGTASSSCGLCGRDQLDDLCLRLAPVAPSHPMEPDVLAGVPTSVRSRQTLFDCTGAVHAAAVFDGTGEIGLVREDVGRHNAVDKIVGRLALDEALRPGPTRPTGSCRRSAPSAPSGAGS